MPQQGWTPIEEPAGWTPAAEEATPQNTYAMVDGRRVPLGGDEADEGHWENPKTGEKIFQSAITKGSDNAKRIAAEGGWTWRPPTGTGLKPADTVVSVGSHGVGAGELVQGAALARNVALPIGKAIVNAAPGMVSRTVAGVAASAPVIKYEASKTVLTKLGVPEPLAVIIASRVSGWEGKGAAAKAEADRLKEVKAIEAAAAAKTLEAEKAAAEAARIAANPPRLVKQGAPTVTSALEQGLKDAMGQPAPTTVTAPVAPGSTVTPGGIPSVPQNFSYPASAEQVAARTGVPPPAPAPIAAPAPPPVSQAAPSPITAAPAAAAPPVQTTASVPFMVTKQMRTTLQGHGYTEPQINAMTPQQAHQALAAGPIVKATAAAAPTSTGLTPKETEAFHAAKAAGLSDEDTKSIIEESRKALGTPRVLSWKPGKGPTQSDAQRMSAEFGSREAARRLKTTQEQIKTLRGASAAWPPEKVRAVIDAAIPTLADDAAKQAYLAAAPNEVIASYVKLKLGLR